MARYRGPVCRLERRIGKNLHLKGERGINGKHPLEKRNYPPGQHGQARTKLSTYGVQLREKQATKRIYGILEKQFRRYVARAERYHGVTGHVLLQLLERRLDNVVYRAGYAKTRSGARQLVGHNHIFVNGKRVNIPSYEVRPGDVITLGTKGKAMKPVLESLELMRNKGRKEWISFNEDDSSSTFLRAPEREELEDIQVREQMIIELYSK